MTDGEGEGRERTNAGAWNPRLLEGGLDRSGLPRRGERVLVEVPATSGQGSNLLRPAVVVFSEFRTFVFRGDVSVRFSDDGSLSLVPRERIVCAQR